MQIRISLYKSQIELQTDNENVQKRFIESNYEWSKYIYAFFNRISLFHPIYKKIQEFEDACNGIGENLNMQETVAVLKKALMQIELSDQHEVREYWNNVGCVITQFVKEEELTDRDMFRSMTNDICESQTEYVESIIACLNLLKTNFSRFEKIANRSTISQFFHDVWAGCRDALVSTVIDIVMKVSIGDIVIQWNNSQKLNDNDFVHLFIETMEAFIDETPKLILTIDDMLNIVYVKHMHIKTAQDLQTLSQIRDCYTRGANGEDVLNQWESRMNGIHIDSTVNEKIHEFLNVTKN